MKVKFWGTRGSIPTPGKTTLRYGGNTSCVELTTSSNTRLILDAGTGLRCLGEEIMLREKQPLHGHILITHTHWDHIQGLPFFAPLFVPGCEWDIYAPLGFEKPLKETLADQMQYTYFPVPLDQVGAHVNYHELIEGEFAIGDIRIKSQYLNHPALTLGYRLEADGVSVVYATDHEPHSRMAAVEGIMDEREQRHIEFLRDADLVIHDAQYTSSEYDVKKGWGHSTIEYAVGVCNQAKVKRLVLTHHDPIRNDKDLDYLVDSMRKRLKENGSSMDLLAAYEGEEITLKGSSNNPIAFATQSTAIDLPLTKIKQSVLLGIDDPTIAATLIEATQTHSVTTDHKNNENSIVKAVGNNPSLVILEDNPPNIDGLTIYRTIREKYKLAQDFPIILVADQEDYDRRSPSEELKDWLLKPFSMTYARSLIQARLLKTSFRWLKAPLPADENQRLEYFQRLNIFDSGPEERFDRLTRLTAALFDVPVVTVTLIDKEHQWFKSAHNCNFSKSSREVSFCAHVLVKRQPMIVPDTFLDDRFADNPVVKGQPNIRFYAGYPLILPDGVCIGTLCLVDIRPRELDEAGIRLLKDMSDLVLEEFQR